ncbi:MAG: hypothetical protein SCM11_10620 [Bacillota bacterium]|nr:hypothetical protein [Bacillota bacterium]
MRKSIHEVLIQTYDILSELNKLQQLFFENKIIARRANKMTIENYIDERFFLWSQSGTCLNLREYMSRIHYADTQNADLWKDVDADLFSERALSNLEFYYNIYKFIGTHIYADDNLQFELSLYLPIESIIEALMDQLSVQAVNVGKDKYIVVSSNDEAVAIAENEFDQSKSVAVLKFNHFKVSGDLEAKRQILMKLYHDFDAGQQREKGTAADDFCYIMNSANIRHNNSERNGHSITDGMSPDQIENVYNCAYRLYLKAKFDIEYMNELKPMVDQYKNPT